MFIKQHLNIVVERHFIYQDDEKISKRDNNDSYISPNAYMLLYTLIVRCFDETVDGKN